MNAASKSIKLMPRLFGYLGPARQKRVLKWLLRRRNAAGGFDFPIDPAAAPKILVLLPSSPRAALHHTPAILSLLSYFTKAEFAFMCSTETAPYAATMFRGHRVLEYSENARRIFSDEFNALNAQVRGGGFSICVLLEREPDLAQLFISGMSGAAVRAAYYDAAEFPFANLHLRLSPGTASLAECGAAMARMLGAVRTVRQQWTVSKKAIEEIGHLIREAVPPSGFPLIGLEIRLFYDTFGQQWTETLIARLRENFQGTVYGFAEKAETGGLLAQRLQKIGMPFFCNLTVPRTAALIAHSAVMICGNSPLFQLVNLLGKQGIGLFEEHEMGIYFKQASHLKCVCYSNKPENAALDAVVHSITELTCNGTKKA
jgi:ADP-heptose:LPS heptosyltransferase